MPFQIQRWSWIFIFQSLLVQPSFAHLSLEGKVMDNLFQRGLSKAEKTRNAYIAVAITATVVLVVGIVGLFLFIQKRKQAVVDAETGADHRPSWWMVDGKTENKDWWGLGSKTQASPPTEPLGRDGRSRTQRLKAALGLRIPDQPILPTHRGTIMSPPLPLQTDLNLHPRYPDSLERGGVNASLPKIPTIAIHSTDQRLERKLNMLPRALLTHSSSRSTSERRVLPRSPAATGRRRSRSLTQPMRNPFLPLRDDGPVSQLATLKTANDSQNSRSHSIDTALQSTFPGRRNPPPALQLKEPETPRSGRKVHFGLPRSPRPSAGI